MTVSTTAVSVSYAGDGGTTAFPITFQFGTSADLSVALIDATGAETAQTLTTHYTVSQSASGTGTLTMLTAPASGYTLRIRRITAKVQPDSLRNKGQYYPETVEQMFDRNTRQIQEVQEATERSLRFPFGSNADGELATPVAGGVPMVNDTEDGFSWALWGTNPEALASLAMGTGSALVGFKQSGTGAVARTMEDKAREVVSLKDFGAVGDGVTVDSGAVQAAFNYCIESGKALYVPPGTYILDSATTRADGYTSIRLLFTEDGQGLTVYGAGKGVSVFKEKAGATASLGTFTKMFYMYLPDATNIAVGKIRFADLTFDKNGASNGTPANPWAYQQAHCFQCIATSASGCSIESFEFVNVEIRDKVAAGINLAIKQEVPVEHVLVNNVTESAWSAQFGQRGDLELTAPCADIRVLNTTVRFSQTEPEAGYEATATYPRNYFYSNCKIGTLQLQEPASASWYANVYLENCHISDEFSTQGLMCHVNNSTVNLPREIYARRGKFTNSTILMDYDSGANTCDSVYIYNGNSNSNYKQEWQFDNCSFVLNTDDQDVLATGYQIQPSNGNKTSARNMKIVRLNNCSFDPRVEKVCTVYEMGDWYFSNCKIRCWGSDAFNAGSASTNPSFLSLSNNDYSELDAATNIVKINRNNELWVLEWHDKLSLDTYRMAVAGGGTFAGYTVRPTILGTARPTTTTKRFNVGDVTHNLAPAAATPVTEWVCTVAGSPGTHVAHRWITTKGTTANRPTLHAGDVGVTYLDTTLVAAGKLITWTGTAWVDATGAAV